MENEYHYQLIEKAIGFLVRSGRRQPDLNEIAAHCNLSPFHFQCIFTEWAGVSPKRFQQFLTLDRLKADLENGADLLDSSLRAGLSSPSRAWYLFVKLEAVTPAEWKSNGRGMRFSTGVHEGPFGAFWLACSDRGIHHMRFLSSPDEQPAFQQVFTDWPEAEIVEDASETEKYARALFEPAPGSRLPLWVKGTPFQLKVWEALLRIPLGQVSTYGRIAAAIGNAGAARAVGTAVGQNPVAFLIPCHRVIRREGKIGNYHWGSERKTAILGWEKAKMEDEPATP